MKRSVPVQAIGRAVLTLAAAAGLAPFGELHAQEPCTAAEYRQFDFWVGVWEVRDSSGTVLGHNTIERVLGGCALHESWRSARSPAGNGHSYSIFDASTGRWHQTWVDASGSLLQLDGGLDDAGRMILQGASVDSTRRVLHRITWSPQPGDELRQLWATSSDAGATWTRAFDGYYHRTKRRGGAGAARRSAG